MFASIDGVLYSILEESVYGDDRAQLLYVPAKFCGRLEIPDTVKGHPVRMSYTGAFEDAVNLTEIILPLYFEHPGDYSEVGLYNCVNLERIDVRAGNSNYVVRDGILFSSDGATVFSYPAAKRDIKYEIPAGVVTIASHAFRGNPYLQDVIFADSVKEIGGGAFRDCSSLSKVDLNEGLTTIWSSAFYCTQVNSIEIPSSIQTMMSQCVCYTAGNNGPELLDGAEIYGYDNCTRAVKYAEDNNIPFRSLGNKEYNATEILTYSINNGEVTLVDCLTGIELDLVIPDTIEGYPVTQIGSFCFERCDITSVVIPDTVTKIGMDAFRFCTKLESVTFPSDLRVIDGEAFSGCVSLIEADIPDSVTYVGNGAFINCTSLVYVNFPKNATYVQSRTFEGCTSLSYVPLHGNIIKICADAFENCDSLVSVSIPRGVTELEYSAFDNCRNLVQIYIPESVTRIGSNVVPSETIICCEPDSYAEYYAWTNGYYYAYVSPYFEDDNGSGTWAWASEYIYNCVNAGLITGYTDGTFLPDKNITRAEFVTILYKTYLGLGGEEVSMGHPFTDASDGWYQNALSWAYLSGVVTGTSGTTFSPNATITRQEMATIMYRFMNTFFELEEIEYNDLSGFTDRGSVASWAMEGVQFCVTCGIINGTSETTLSPTASATRAQAATIISRTFIE